MYSGTVWIDTKCKLLVKMTDRKVRVIYNALIWRWDEGSANGSLIAGSAHPGWLIINELGRLHEINFEDFDISALEDISAEDCVDVQGKLIIPGLHDGHIHVEMVGESSYFVNLHGCDSITSLQGKLLSHANKNPDLPWLVGVNWDQMKMERYPSRHDLDSVCKDRPIFLWRACWHIGVANTCALERAGISLDQSYFEVPGGVVEVAENSPTGIVKERACELITKAMGEKTYEQKLKFIKDGLAVCAKFGLTSVQTNDELATKVYAALMEANELPLRVFLTPMHHEITSNEDFRALPWLRRSILSVLDSDISAHDSRLSVHRVKIFGDGALGSETAALRTDSGDMTGVLIHETHQLCSMIQEARDNDFRLEIHAIGDAAAEQVLGALETLGVRPEERPLLTHAQVLNENLMTRLKSLNVIANIQPSFVPTDMEWVQARLSDNQQTHAYAWKSMLSRGICVAGGSDAPIETSSPLVGMYDAIHRRSREDESKIYKPEEALSFSEALWIYTVNPAFSTCSENTLGRIEKGFAADLVVIDPDIIENPSLLGTIAPDMVIVGGVITYVKKEARVEEVASDLFCGPVEGPFIPGKNGGRIYTPQVSNSLFVDSRPMENREVSSTFEYGGYSCRCCRLWK